MNKKAPFIVTISGVGGAGKNSVMEVFKNHPEKFVYFVSYTDRPQRQDDVPGETYHFLTKEEFSDSIKKNEFIEWEQVRGEYRYGRKKVDLKNILESGHIPVMQIEVLGAQKFKKICKIVTFFIMPPSVEEAKARMEKRGTDSAEAIGHRFERYDMELSYKDKYDHIIVNDELEKAQKEILDLVELEIKKAEKKAHSTEIVRNIGVVLSLFLVIGFGFWQSYQYEKTSIGKRLTTLQVAPKEEVVVTPPVAEPVKPETPVVATPVAKTPSKEVKKKIASSAPKYTPPPQSVVGETKTNGDGSTTTSVSTGGATNDADLQKITDSQVSANTPLAVPFVDETGRYADMKNILLEYMNSSLRWKSEISELKELAIRDAGASGWLGIYEGSYVQESGGHNYGSGMIVLNTYYIENIYCAGNNDFDGCEREFLKYVLAHEYGHHYTIYHKLVDWSLLPSQRFPDSYYETRPLSKTSTATDYSLGWKNCEAEIIAEDYSYFYSGYGVHRMVADYGNPSSATRTWIDNIGALAPTVSIVSPLDGTTISGNVNFGIEATSSVAIKSVSFYLGDTLISVVGNKALEMALDTTAHVNGAYILRVVVDNGIFSTTKEISVTINNIPPVENPPQNPLIP